VALENHSPQPGYLSLFDLEVCKSLAEDPQTLQVDFAQCLYGATTAKPTRVLYGGGQISPTSTRENVLTHFKSWTYTQWNGATATK
jgi:hypothetical protein